jgi:hypothetical protein
MMASRWNGLESRHICGLSAFSLRCTTALKMCDPAPCIIPADACDNGHSRGAEDIVDEALFYFKTLVLLPKLRVDKSVDRVLLVLVSFLHACLQSNQAAHRAEAARTLSQLCYSYAQHVAQSEQLGPL